MPVAIAVADDSSPLTRANRCFVAAGIAVSAIPIDSVERAEIARARCGAVSAVLLALVGVTKAAPVGGPRVARGLSGASHPIEPAIGRQRATRAGAHRSPIETGRALPVARARVVFGLGIRAAGPFTVTESFGVAIQAAVRDRGTAGRSPRDGGAEHDTGDASTRTAQPARHGCDYGRYARCGNCHERGRNLPARKALRY